MEKHACACEQTGNGSFVANLNRMLRDSFAGLKILTEVLYGHLEPAAFCQPACASLLVGLH